MLQNVVTLKGSYDKTVIGDGPLAQVAEHLTFNQVVRSSNLRWLTIMYGPMVNRLRHRPFTAEWGVRLSLGSPLPV